MRLDEDAVRDTLADAWQRWARRCAELTTDQWATVTRCQPWDVQGPVAHVCPDRAMFDALVAARTDGPAAVTDAAELLRRFNAPGGIAHTSAGAIAERAATEAAELTPNAAVTRFLESAEILCATPMSAHTTITYPVAGSTTLAVVAEVALMEATVHMLDLADAVGGITPSPQALTATRDLLIAVPDPVDAVEVLAGRSAPAAAVPAIR
ncbi:maleylpyruvate isomerase N-terminal domain-containing protein [Mycobacterium sp. 3519A]|uniref:maleylpyruvate isomerase N-terminal domain-containing protein n=1 Tax=Mycobacterium sp. 3519A TaxID=2057184 RepID=UPI000C7D7A94|nr:maleylpyruvate isomerase N-terminal domain-containing protein [Mycobacterium sp. 3519A]